MLACVKEMENRGFVRGYAHGYFLGCEDILRNILEHYRLNRDREWAVKTLCSVFHFEEKAAADMIQNVEEGLQALKAGPFRADDMGSPHRTVLRME